MTQNGETDVKTNQKNKTAETRRLSKKQALRRQKIRRRIFAAAVAAAAIIFAVIFVPRVVSWVEELRGSGARGEIATEEVDISELRHLSFDTLSIEEGETSLSVSEFQDILGLLYNMDYVIIDVYDITDKDENGNFVYKDTITVPEGKKPLIISQSDVCYPMDAQDKGVAENLLLNTDEIKAQYTASGVRKINGDYDVVPILESFIADNPDFSYNGARAVLALNGYCGVLGYRTASIFNEDDNPYASYGTFDTDEEASEAEKVVDALKAAGYHFACCGYAEDISYGAEYSLVSSDIKSWISEVTPIIGSTDLMMLPKQTDIASWAGYDDDNAKFKLLSEAGFKYFFVGNNTTPYLFQVGDGYVRQMTYEINTYANFESALSGL